MMNARVGNIIFPTFAMMISWKRNAKGNVTKNVVNKIQYSNFTLTFEINIAKENTNLNIQIILRP